MATQVYPHLVADPMIHAGKPVIEGTRVLARALVERVAAGESLEDAAREHGVTVQDVRAALEYAAQRIDEPLAAAEPARAAPTDTAHAAVGRQAVDEEARRVGLDPAQLSPLGRRLLEVRAQGIAAGEPLLATWDELDAEIRDRRGGRHADAD